MTDIDIEAIRKHSYVGGDGFVRACADRNALLSHIAALEAGREARELALLEFARQHSVFKDGELTDEPEPDLVFYTDGQILAAFNATQVKS